VSTILRVETLIITALAFSNTPEAAATANDGTSATVAQAAATPAKPTDDFKVTSVQALPALVRIASVPAHWWKWDRKDSCSIADAPAQRASGNSRCRWVRSSSSLLTCG
jgi:hypothetical protein